MGVSLLIRDFNDSSDPRNIVVFFGVVAVVVPAQVRLAVLGCDPQVGFENRPVLIEVFVRLLVEPRGQRLPEQKAHSNEQQREHDGVYRRERKSQPSRKMSSFRHSPLRPV